jgi:hypothetical protein
MVDLIRRMGCMIVLGVRYMRINLLLPPVMGPSSYSILHSKYISLFALLT